DQGLEGARRVENQRAARLDQGRGGPLPAIPETDRKRRAVVAAEECIEDLRPFAIGGREHHGVASPSPLDARALAVSPTVRCHYATGGDWQDLKQISTDQAILSSRNGSGTCDICRYKSFAPSALSQVQRPPLLAA